MNLPSIQKLTSIKDSKITQTTKMHNQNFATFIIPSRKYNVCTQCISSLSKLPQQPSSLRRNMKSHTTSVIALPISPYWSPRMPLYSLGLTLCSLCALLLLLTFATLINICMVSVLFRYFPLCLFLSPFDWMFLFLASVVVLVILVHLLFELPFFFFLLLLILVYLLLILCIFLLEFPLFSFAFGI